MRELRLFVRLNDQHQRAGGGDQHRLETGEPGSRPQCSRQVTDGARGARRAAVCRRLSWR